MKLFTSFLVCIFSIFLVFCYKNIGSTYVPPQFEKIEVKDARQIVIFFDVPVTINDVRFDEVNTFFHIEGETFFLNKI